MPDPVKGEVAWLYCVLRPGFEPSDELRAEVRARGHRRCSARRSRPARIGFVTGLPKTRSAKIVRRAVRAAALGDDLGDTSSIEDPAVLAQVRAPRRGHARLAGRRRWEGHVTGRLLEGKRALVAGVANKRSIAWAIAQALHGAGAELAFTYQGERLEGGGAKARGRGRRRTSSSSATSPTTPASTAPSRRSRTREASTSWCTRSPTPPRRRSPSATSTPRARPSGSRTTSPPTR